MYRIIYAKKISKFLKKVSLNQLQKIKTKMELVARDPFSNHPNLTSLKGMTVGYRLRVGKLIFGGRCISFKRAKSGVAPD